MKKLVLTLIAAGAFLIAPSLSQAQNVKTAHKQCGNSELVQLTEQLSQVAVSLEQVANVLDVHSNKLVNAKDGKLSQKIIELQKNLEKAAQKLEKIEADRNIHSAPEVNEDDLQDLV